MKNIFFYIIISTSLVSFGQNKIIDVLSEKQKDNPTEAIIMADSLLLTNQSDSDIVLIKYYQATAYQNNSNPKKSIGLLNEILPLFNLKHEFYIRTLLHLSDANTRLKNYSKATNQALKALELSKKHQFNQLFASANTALSFISYANKDYIKSLEYLLSTATLQEKLNDSVPLSASYNNIAIVYNNIGEFDKALTYNKRSLEISKLKKDKIGIGKSYSNIGRIHVLKGNNFKARHYYKLAIENNDLYHIKNSIPYRNIGDTYLNQKKYNKAEDFYLKALNIEADNNQHNLLDNIYKSLLKNAILKNDFKKALLYQSKADSIFKLNMRHENEEKIKMLEYQHKLFKNKEILKQEKKNNKKNKIIFVILTSLLLLLGLFIFQRNKNNKLKIESEKMFLEQQVLRSQMNPHFIFNALSAIQNSLLDNEPIKSATYLSRFAKLIRQNFDFINEKTILLNDEIDALKNYMDTQKMRFQDKFDYEINIFANVDMYLIKIPPLLLQPFVENSIEHGFKNKKEKGKIIINISEIENNVCFEIIDNGKGFDTSKKDTRIHAIDVFKKRLKLRNYNEEKLFKIETDKKGTIIKFCLQQC